MRKIICFLIIAGVALLPARPDAAESNTAVVTSPVENMYRAGTETSDVVSQAVIGTRLKVIASSIDARTMRRMGRGMQERQATAATAPAKRRPAGVARRV